MKEKTDKLDLIKTQNVFKDTIKKVKDNLWDERKYLRIMYLRRDFYPEYINPYSSRIKRQHGRTNM